jgi:GNAT superfamily N-acetyltransferase
LAAAQNFTGELNGRTKTMTGNFLADLVGVAPQAGAGTYAFSDAHGERVGFLQLISESHTEVIIHRIWALHPRRGHGSAILRRLCDLADRHGITLKLKALPFGATPYPLTGDQLFDWYARHGFESRRRKMVRPPRTTPRSSISDFVPAWPATASNASLVQ